MFSGGLGSLTSLGKDSHNKSVEKVDESKDSKPFALLRTCTAGTDVISVMRSKYIGGMDHGKTN